MHLRKQCCQPLLVPSRSGPTRLRDFEETLSFLAPVSSWALPTGFPAGVLPSWCPRCHHRMNLTSGPKASLMGNCLLHLQPSLTLTPDFRTFQDSRSTHQGHLIGRVLPTRYPPPHPLIQHPPCARRNHLSSTWTLMDRRSKCSALPWTQPG